MAESQDILYQQMLEAQRQIAAEDRSGRSTPSRRSLPATPAGSGVSTPSRRRRTLPVTPVEVPPQTFYDCQDMIPERPEPKVEAPDQTLLKKVKDLQDALKIEREVQRRPEEFTSHSPPLRPHPVQLFSHKSPDKKIKGKMKPK